MARPILSFDSGRLGLLNAQPPWQNNSNFPIPPRNTGFLHPLPGQALNSNVILGGARGMTGNAIYNQMGTRNVGILDNQLMRNRNNNNLSSSMPNITPPVADRYQANKGNFNRNSNTTPKKLTANEVQAKAMKHPLSTEFYDEIKKLTQKSQAFNKALEYAQKEHCQKKHIPYPLKSTGHGLNFCNICKMNFLNRNNLGNHYKSAEHRELEDLFDIKKEQARLIMDGKLSRPEEVAKSDDKTSEALKSVYKAEVEMNLKPKDMDLDAYILGVYESIMKPYWPVPKSTHYCRICNYQEFNNEFELKRHQNTRQHIDRERTYDEAFCLFCQEHTGGKKSMELHEKSAKHIKVKDLMETTKQAAIEHWHSIHGKPLPEQYKKVEKKDDTKVGAKRSAAEDTNTSPSKKMNSGVSASPSSAQIRPPPSTQNRSATTTTPVRPDVKSTTPKRPDVKSTTPKRPDVKSTTPNKTDMKVVVDLTKSKEEEEKKKKSVEPVAADDSMWFAPIYGFMCIACRKFLANSTEQKAHAKLASHSVAIDKFKKSITG